MVVVHEVRIVRRLWTLDRRLFLGLGQGRRRQAEGQQIRLGVCSGLACVRCVNAALASLTFSRERCCGPRGNLSRGDFLGCRRRRYSSRPGRCASRRRCHDHGRDPEQCVASSPPVRPLSRRRRRCGCAIRLARRRDRRGCGSGIRLGLRGLQARGEDAPRAARSLGPRVSSFASRLYTLGRSVFFRRRAHLASSLLLCHIHLPRCCNAEHCPRHSPALRELFSRFDRSGAVATLRVWRANDSPSCRRSAEA